jgi:DNA adenine methylase
LWSGALSPRLVEPFCGGVAIAFGLRPSSVLLNDINPHPINFYSWLKRGFESTLEMRNERDLYYRHRSAFNALIQSGGESSREAAELFYYLNRTCYNGLCRFNRKGEFNVPFGAYATISYSSDFSPYRELFATWDFVVGDFERIALHPDDFVYADPPYDVQFTQYAKEDFIWEDQIRLAQWLTHHEGPVVLSNQATPRVIDLYTSLGYELRFVDAPRMISCTGDRRRAREVLALRGF